MNASNTTSEIAAISSESAFDLEDGMDDNVRPKPQGCTNFKLRQLLRRVSQRYDAELALSGIKTTQYSLLSQVLHRGPIRPVDLARAMTMDASTLTRNLKPLIAAGWLDLLPGEDARSRLVQITDAGREKREEAKAGWHRAQLQLNAQLGESHVAALHAFIDDALLLLASDDGGGLVDDSLDSGTKRQGASHA